MATDAPLPGAAPEYMPLEASANAAKPVRHPMLRREFLALVAWTVCADYLIFRTLGYAGPALFFALVPVFFLARPLAAKRKWIYVTYVCIVLLCAARLVWSGSAAVIASSVAITIALSMIAAGGVPTVFEGLVFVFRSLHDGIVFLGRHRLPRWFGVAEVDFSKTTSASWWMPMLASLVFGGIFVLANPDLLSWSWQQLESVFDRMASWFGGMSLWEIPFCLTALYLGAGFLKPVVPLLRVGPRDKRHRSKQAEMSVMFAAFRNTLLTLIALYAGYLVFEFITLWRRDFPAGFYYAGYAHQGAAWLTFALALATALLSFVFSGATYKDPRVRQLNGLTWIWSAQNLLLAAAVYNRLLIYVGYNGMTRMRTVGFFGITIVVIGFGLVLRKIVAKRGFWWLIRAQLVALMLVLVALSIFPVDYLAHRYNIRQVTAGRLHPSVMIAVKPMQDEGLLPLIDVADQVTDPIIREGMLAMLAERQLEIEAFSKLPWHWTKYQASTDRLYRRLKRSESLWADFLAYEIKRKQAIKSFRAYSMQWY